MFVLIFSEPIYRYWFVSQEHGYSNEEKQLDSLMTTWRWENTGDSATTEEQSPPATIRLFAFDPNQASKEELQRLGFKSFLATRIVNYRAKGGKFLAKSDLLKIYGMDSLLYQKLIPFIKLPEVITKEKSFSEEPAKEKPGLVKFDLNKADTSQLIKIYGIGPKLSLRIVAYREKLGGFISTSQLNEVYGLDSTVVKELASKSFIEEDFQPNRININSATEKELGAHSYIKYKLAKAIVAYRMQHGSFKSVEDLKKISIVDEKSFLRMAPYIEVR